VFFVIRPFLFCLFFASVFVVLLLSIIFICLSVFGDVGGGDPCHVRCICCTLMFTVIYIFAYESLQCASIHVLLLGRSEALRSLRNDLQA